MSVPDGLFPRGSGVDLVKRQGDFDEFFWGFDWVLGGTKKIREKAIITPDSGRN